MGIATGTGTVEAFLDTEFDLAYRPKAGDEHFYRMDACYRLLTERGTLNRRDSYLGDLRRVVESIAGNVSTETITWRNVVKRWADQDEPYANPEPIEWAEGFEYSYSTLDYPSFLAGIYAKAKDFPRDFLGWNVLLLAIDAHVEFDYPRTPPGQIEKLRRIGDAFRLEPKGEAPGIDFSPFIHTSPWQPKPLYSRFVGLTVSSGEPGAIIESELRDRSMFDMFMNDRKMQSSSSLMRRIVLRLSDGALESGTSVEWVCSEGMWINPIYTITRIAVDEFNRGSK